MSTERVFGSSAVANRECLNKKASRINRKLLDFILNVAYLVFALHAFDTFDIRSVPLSNINC